MLLRLTGEKVQWEKSQSSTERKNEVLFKTRGVVFRFTRYGDTSVIASIFTEHFGLQSYIVNGVRSKNARNNKIALFQPLTLLELVVYHKENANINRIKEVRCLYPYQQLPTDFLRSSIAMFVNEVMNRTVKEESHAQDLYSFLYSSLVTLDTLEENIENFHLLFLLKLSRFLGFGPRHPSEILGMRMTDDACIAALTEMIEADYTRKIVITNQQRREILQLLVGFYQDHTGLTGELKSLQVLREIQR